MARHRYAALEALGAKPLTLDIRDRGAVLRAVVPVDVVLHLAAKVGQWGPRHVFQAVNVDGTRNSVEATRAAGSGRLVYTSSPSVVGYRHDIEKGSSDLPVATRHESAYSESKAMAERLILMENGPWLRTVVLRPHLIFGPGDPHMLPRLLEHARQGTLRRIGSGRNRVDLTYIDNAAWAHLDAADALLEPEPRCAGRAYFISNDEPVIFWDWLNGLLQDLAIPPVRRSVPRPLAQLAAQALETTWRVCRLPGEPAVTRLVAGALARSHWYDMGPALSDLGYRPRVPMGEATRLTVDWLRTRQ